MQAHVQFHPIENSVPKVGGHSCSAMWVIGGDPQSGYLSDVWKSDDGINWIELLDTIPGFLPMRTMPMIASANGSIYSIGGQQNTYSKECLNQVWKTDDGINWTQLPDAPWLGRSMILNSCVDDNDTIWLLGGGRLWDRRCYHDVWKTGDGISWELVNESAPWQARYWHNVAWYDNKMWVLCGISDQTNSAETWYSSNGIDWYELKHPKYADRHAASVTVFNNYLWMMTGIISNDCWRLRNTLINSVDEKKSTDKSLIIYPNPSSGSFQIQKGSNYSSYIIYNEAGQKIQQGNFTKSKVAETISVKAKNGIYFIMVYDDSGNVVTKKLIVI